MNFLPRLHPPRALLVLLTMIALPFCRATTIIPPTFSELVAKAETVVASTPLESAKVISLKNDLGLAVINTGAESGLRLGTPMRLVRGEKIVATGLVVDVRSRIAGLLMTSTTSAGALKVGDLAKPETIPTLK